MCILFCQYFHVLNYTVINKVHLITCYANFLLSKPMGMFVMMMRRIVVIY